MYIIYMPSYISARSSKKINTTKACRISFLSAFFNFISFEALFSSWLLFRFLSSLIFGLAQFFATKTLIFTQKMREREEVGETEFFHFIIISSAVAFWIYFKRNRNGGMWTPKQHLISSHAHIFSCVHTFITDNTYLCIFVHYIYYFHYFFVFILQCHQIYVARYIINTYMLLNFCNITLPSFLNSLTLIDVNYKVTCICTL